MHVEETIKDQIKDQIRNDGSADAESAEQEVAATRPGMFSGRASRIEVAGFLREFGVLLEAGYTVTRGLNLLAKNTSHENLRVTIETIAAQVERGAAVSKAMARYPWYFDPVIVSIVKAAEGSGKLDKGLAYIADMVEYDQEIRDKVAHAMTYPLILMGVTASVIFVLLVFVVPIFATSLEQAGGGFTGLSAVVFGASEVLRSPLWLAIIAGSISGVAYGLMRWRRSNELAFDAMVGRIPIVGRMMMLAALTRFVNMFHMLAVNNVSIPQALDLAKGALGNAYLRTVIDDMHKSVEAGKGMGDAMRKYSDLPHVAVDMISVAEESGKIEQVLGSLAKTMRTQMTRTAQRITVIIEPALLVIMGVLVTGIVTSFFMPYLQLLTSVAGMK